MRRNCCIAASGLPSRRRLGRARVGSDHVRVMAFFLSTVAKCGRCETRQRPSSRSASRRAVRLVDLVGWVMRTPFWLSSSGGRADLPRAALILIKPKVLVESYSLNGLPMTDPGCANSKEPHSRRSTPTRPARLFAHAGIAGSRSSTWRARPRSQNRPCTLLPDQGTTGSPIAIMLIQRLFPG